MKNKRFASGTKCCNSRAQRLEQDNSTQSR
uniref:Uncharacterized protein n=1 Tax=Arundo donax TaxID=35708 RepID=A0A0A9BR44_ARUDO